MSSIRPMVQDAGGLMRNARSGDSLVEVVIPQVISAAGAKTLTVSDIARGAIVFTGLSAGANLTTPAAADILAAYPNLDIGESVSLYVGIKDAYALTLVAGSGVTLAGRATVPASGNAKLYFTKTSATAVTCTVV